MSSHRSFIRGTAALQSLTIGLASQAEQIKQNEDTGYTIQARHLQRQRSIAEVSGAFEPLTPELFLAYRAMFPGATRATEFPDLIPELPSNDIVSAAQSLAFASATTKGTPAERSDIQIWSSAQEYVAIGVMSFGDLDKSYFLITQWSDSDKLTDEQAIIKAYRAASKSKAPERDYISPLLVAGKVTAASLACLAGFVVVVGGVVYLITADHGERPSSGPTQYNTATACEVIETNSTYVIETPVGVFIQPIRGTTAYTKSHLVAGGGGRGGGGHGGSGSSGSKSVRVVHNPLPIEGKTYKIEWKNGGERLVQEMNLTTNKSEGGGCRQ